MSDFSIREARPEDLNFAFDMFEAAGDGLTERFLGGGSRERAFRFVTRLWVGTPNRFHYRNCLVLESSGEKLGLLSSYAVGDDGYSSLSYSHIMAAGGPRLLWHYVTNIGELILSQSLPEGQDGEYYISMVAAAPKARGKGIGTRLVNCAIERARELGKEKVSLVVTKDNEGAIKLYKRMGFCVDYSSKASHKLVHRMFLKV